MNVNFSGGSRGGAEEQLFWETGKVSPRNPEFSSGFRAIPDKFDSPPVRHGNSKRATVASKLVSRNDSFFQSVVPEEIYSSAKTIWDSDKPTSPVSVCYERRFLRGIPGRSGKTAFLGNGQSVPSQP